LACLKLVQQQILTATRTELSFAHLANDFYDPALDGLPPSVFHLTYRSRSPL
jgi:hypothetical protein